MFSWFGGGKDTRFATVIPPEVGFALQRGRDFPSGTPAVPPGPGRCSRTALEGTLPAARFTSSVIPGQSASAFRIDGVPGQPPLVIANTLVAPKRFEIWEMDPAATRFIRRREIVMPAEAGDWIARRIADAACLPAGRLFLAVVYVGARDERVGLRYDTASNALVRLGPLAHRVGDFDAYLDTRPAGRDAVVLRYDSDPVRLAPERDANGRSHFLLFSPRHPDGLEVLTWGLDDGAVGRWNVVDGTLWLELVNPRATGAPVVDVRSLELSKLL